jgi:hypothetical protein
MPQAARILFIGNSFTNRNDLPGLLTALAAAAKPSLRVETDRVIANGMSLKAHWRRGVALDKIRAGKWDYVVLQEQSTLPLKNPARMHESVLAFDAEIKAAGAKTALYMTWARRAEFHRQDALSEEYLSVGRELGALVVPAGVAWQRALAEDPGLVLHDRDGSHPNPVGTYLAVCTFFAALFSRSPVGVAIEAPGLGELAPDRVRQLERVAYVTAEKLRQPGRRHRARA